MRSRFASFRTGDIGWVLKSWHETTRPRDLDLADNPVWRGLQFVDTVDGGSEDASDIVGFRATYAEENGGIGMLHERSRFVREDGRWYLRRWGRELALMGHKHLSGSFL